MLNMATAEKGHSLPVLDFTAAHGLEVVAATIHNPHHAGDPRGAPSPGRADRAGSRPTGHRGTAPVHGPYGSAPVARRRRDPGQRGAGHPARLCQIFAGQRLFTPAERQL
ncbi:hypothetical protein DFAR_220007 [Desulfarculales bacterium]